ncbi:2790_t:CDS:1, partial [Cetraspora pellucida]
IMSDFKLIEVILDMINISGTHAATELFEKFQLLLSKFGLAQEKIISITNANKNVKTALSQMQIEVVLCLANSLKISIELGLPYANDILNKSKKLIEI